MPDLTMPRLSDSMDRANGRAAASPLARRVAARLGVDLAALAGSGPRGRIVKRDVEAAAPAPVAEAPSAAPPAPAPPTEAPDFALTTEVDMDAAVELRARLAEIADPTPSYNDLVVAACGRALARHPRANGSFADDRFLLHERVNVGVAVAAEDALLVPVVADADRRSLGAIAREIRTLAEQARAGTLEPVDLEGATFTVSNLGMLGVTSFTAVLNPPQAAILAVGALEQRAVVVDGELAVGWRMTITLTCDHRILNGADAAALLADVRAALEQPLRLAL